MITILTRVWQNGIYTDLTLAIPVKYRSLISGYCARIGNLEHDTYWMTGTEPQLWLQLDGVFRAD